MKKLTTIFTTAIMLIVLAVTLSVNVSAAGTSMSNASNIYMNTTYSDSITSTNREDYYKFTLSSSGRITIDITSYMQYYCLVIYNSAGEELWYTDYNEWVSTTGTRSDKHTIDLISGTYYLKANGYRNSDWYASTGNYNFKVTFVSANETEAEPNNSIANAASLNVNSLINGQIAINDIEDYYKFTLSSSGRITIDITSYMQYYCLVIYNSAGEELWYTDYNEWVSTTGTRSDKHTIDLISGTYYLKANGYRNSDWYASTGNYNFKVTFASANETEAEPNNSIANAASLNVNSLINGQIAINDREDYYKFIIYSDCDILIDITSYMQYYCLVIYNSSGEEVWYTDYNEWVSTSGKRADKHIVTLSKGTYYLKVNGYRNSDWYASTGNYSFKIAENIVVPTVSGVSSSESNNSITLKWGKVSGVTGYQIYKYDSSKKKYVLAATTSNTSYTFSNLSNGTNCNFKVRAYITKNGAIYYGSLSSAYTTSTRPAKASKFTATQTSSSITLKWNKVAGATGYRIYVYNSSKDKYVKLKDVTGTKYTVKKISGEKLKEGKTYKFAIKPYFKGSKTVWCSSFKYLTTSTDPGKPTLKVTAATKKATLKWSKENCTGYVIYMKTGKNGEYKEVVTVKGKSKISYTVKNLKKGKTYYFKVKAYKNVDGKTIYSSASKTQSVKITK